MKNAFINDFQSSVQIYYKELKKYKPLTKNEEKQLLVDAKTNAKSRNLLMEANLKFVFDVAKNYKGKGVPLGDLISEGNLGLSYAIDKFDPTRDVKLISYAVNWIRYYIQKAIAKREKEVFVESGEEILDKLFIDDAFSENNEDDISEYSKYDIIDDSMEEEERYNDREVIIKSVFEILDDREKLIIQKYYGLNGYKRVKLKDIGNDIGVTAERVRQLRNIAFDKIRKKTSNNKFLQDTVYSCLS